jgi:hypothetical protein
LQHGSPSLPHDSQKPLEEQTCWLLPNPVHALPVATHFDVVPEVSQQPPVHRSPVQHGCPGPPHAMQLVPEQTVDPFEQVSPS